jgi:hypothetical protein
MERRTDEFTNDDGELLDLLYAFNLKRVTVAEYLSQTKHKELDEYTDDELRHADWIVQVVFIDMNRRPHVAWYHSSQINNVELEVVGLDWATMEEMGYIESERYDGATLEEFIRKAEMGNNVIAFRSKRKVQSL